MLKQGFITEVQSETTAVGGGTEETGRAQKPSTALTDQQAAWNELRMHAKLKEAELEALKTMLIEVEKNGQQEDLGTVLTTARGDTSTTAFLLYPLPRSQTFFESEQLSHVLHRSQVCITARKAAILRVQREIWAIASLQVSASGNVGDLEAHCLTSLKELHILQRHKSSLESEFSTQRIQGLSTLEAQHKAMAEALKGAKEDKAKQLANEGNVEKLKAWLGRQREARKVMRLYIGLEEMGRKRIKRVLETVIRGCRGNTLDEALSNYSTTLARNNSLIHEAEYKLAQQASCIIRLSSMLTELQSLTSRISTESAASLLFRLNKSDIYQAPALMRMRLAEITITSYEQKRHTQSLLLAKSSDCINSLYQQLLSFDPWHRSSARLSLDVPPSKSPVAVLLLVEKRVLFLYERVTPWIAAFANPPKSDSHLAYIRTRGHLDSTKSRVSTMPRTSTFMDGLTGRGLTAMVERNFAVSGSFPQATPPQSGQTNLFTRQTFQIRPENRRYS